MFPSSTMLFQQLISSLELIIASCLCTYCSYCVGRNTVVKLNVWCEWWYIQLWWFYWHDGFGSTRSKLLITKPESSCSCKRVNQTLVCFSIAFRKFFYINILLSSGDADSQTQLCLYHQITFCTFHIFNLHVSCRAVHNVHSSGHRLLILKDFVQCSEEMWP